MGTQGVVCYAVKGRGAHPARVQHERQALVALLSHGRKTRCMTCVQAHHSFSFLINNMASDDDFEVPKTEENIQIMINGIVQNARDCYVGHPKRDHILILIEMARLAHEEDMKQFLRNRPNHVMTQADANALHEFFIDCLRVQWDLNDNLRRQIQGEQCVVM